MLVTMPPHTAAARSGPTVSIRFPEDLHELFKKITVREERSFNSQVIYALRQWATEYAQQHPEVIEA